MKFIQTLGFILFSVTSYAHEHHVKHNMVLVGDRQIFASHIVYKRPHNYQVIVKVSFAQKIKAKYFEARKMNPKNLLIYFLDEGNISKIQSEKSISGNIYSEDPSGNRSLIVSHVVLHEGQFEVVYFDELSFITDEMHH